MAGSNLTAFTYIQERAEATPALFNSIFSVLSQNIAEANSSLISSNISTLGLVTINSRSTVTDYLFLQDPSGHYASWLIGSNSGTTDALNFYNASAGTLTLQLRADGFTQGKFFDSGGQVFNVLAYGVAGTGTGDDSTAIQTAINSAAGVGASVFFPPGRYRIDKTLTVPQFVSLIGSGASSIITAGAAMASMISVDLNSNLGNRYGVIERLALHGGSIASIGLYCGCAVQRSFKALSIESCTDAGLVVNGAQNCLFEQVSLERNGTPAARAGGGLRLNNGAGNNLFLNCEFNLNGPTAIISVQSANADSATSAQGFSAGPSGNHFVGCIIERPVSSMTTLVALFTGRRNQFINCDFSSQSKIWAVSLASQNGQSADLNEFTGCFFAGQAASGDTVFRAETSAFRNRVVDCFFETHQAVAEADNTAVLWFDGLNQYSGSGSTFVNLSGITDTNFIGPQFLTQVAFNRPSLFTVGSVNAPALSFSVDSTIGFYRSAASITAYSGNTFRFANGSWNLLSTGTMFQIVNDNGAGFYIDTSNRLTPLFKLDVQSGSALNPGLRFTSEISLGLYRSGNSTLGVSYGTFWPQGALWASSGMSIGNSTAGGTLIPAISSISSLVGAFVVQGSASSFTIIVWSAAQPGDQILTTVMQSGAVSSLSSGLVLHSHCSQAGQIEFRLSNISTLAQNQSSRTYFFTRITPF